MQTRSTFWGVNGVYDLSYMGLRGVVSKVKIRDQGDLKSRKRRTLFDDDRILPHIDPSLHAGHRKC